MVRNTMALLVSVLIGWGMAHAQQPTASEATPDELIKNTTALAATLQARITELGRKIEEAKTSTATGSQMFDEMTGAVKGIHDALADDSRLWTELRSLLGVWEKRVKDAETKSLTDSHFQKDVQFWQDIITQAEKLRNNISIERANSLALLQRIERDKARLLAARDRDIAKQVLAGLTDVFGQLEALNKGMQTLAGDTEQFKRVPH